MVILFDLGGVLVDLNKNRCLEGFQQLGFDATPYIGAFGQKGVFEKLEEGKIQPTEFYAALRQLGLSSNATDEAIKAAWNSFLVGIPKDRLALLLKIKQHYPTAVLSNTNAVMWERLLTYFQYEGHDIHSFFDRLFLSFEWGMCKPSPALFEAVVQDLGVAAEEILFLDDSEENCAAARRCGMQAVHAPAGGGWKQLFSEDGRLLLYHG